MKAITKRPYMVVLYQYFISSFTFGGGYVVVSMVRKYFVEKEKFSMKVT